MKKFLAILLALTMLLSLLAGCASGENKEEDGNEDQNQENNEQEEQTPESALVILETVWNAYGEDERFAVIGGNMEAPVDGAPGNYDMEYAENLTYNLLVPAEQLESVDEAATMIHMMNANTFTSGVVHLTDGTDTAAFAQVIRDAIQSNQWMCGFPETLTIAVVGGEYVVIAFGLNDAMTPFNTHLAEAYPDVQVLYNEAIAG